MRIFSVLVMLALALPASAQTTPACPDREEFQRKLERRIRVLSDPHPVLREWDWDPDQLRAEIECLEREIEASKTAEPPVTPAPARP